MTLSDWCPKRTFAHPQGQVVAVEVQQEGRCVVVVSVYASTRDMRKNLMGLDPPKVGGKRCIGVR